MWANCSGHWVVQSRHKKSVSPTITMGDTDFSVVDYSPRLFTQTLS